MGRKTRPKKQPLKTFPPELSEANILAMQEGPTKRKKWSIHDLMDLKPLREPQERMIRSYIEGNNIIANGVAGTGKTLLGCYLALTDILTKESLRKRIIIVRSIVPSRDIGFLKGSTEEKMAPYESPYIDIFAELLGKAASYENMKEAGVITFAPTSFLRGKTWDNAVVIVDESQNCNFEELNTVMGRIGRNTSVIVIGDTKQNDLYRSKFDQSGFGKFLKIASHMREFDEIKFGKEDVVRSDFAKSWICAVDEFEE